MKKIKFLIRLMNEGKFEIIEPSVEIAESYIQKSDSHFESAKILLEKEKLGESVSMSYYGMYHILLSLLFKCGIKSENHSASILLLKELFDESDLSKKINFAKKERIDKQYYTDFKITKLECKEIIKKTEEFVIEIKKVIKQLNQENILKLRQKLKRVLRNEK